MIASSQVTNSDILAFIVVLVFKLLNRKDFLSAENTIETKEVQIRRRDH